MTFNYYVIFIYFNKVVDLNNIESQLKKRLAYPYKWGQLQNNHLDKKSNFIYHTISFEELLQKIELNFKNEKNYDNLFNYTLNRWYNFQSAKAVEHIFSCHQLVTPATNSKDKQKDFFINDIPFDHKTSVFPKKLNLSFNEAINQPKKVCQWLYTNQSKQGRFHLKNRLFILLFDREGEHWKLKADISSIGDVVNHYLKNFNIEHLVKLQFSNNESALSDIIWLTK